VIEPKTKEEYAKIVANNPVAVKVFTWSGCPHCKAYKPEVEKACVDLNKATSSPVIPVIHCPVDKDFCSDEMSAMGMKGVPFTIAEAKMPLFSINGNNPEELKQYFGKLKPVAIEMGKRIKGGDAPVDKERRK